MDVFKCGNALKISSAYFYKETDSKSNCISHIFCPSFLKKAQFSGLYFLGDICKCREKAKSKFWSFDKLAKF